MNKVYKTIWNAAKRCYAVVDETRMRKKGSGSLTLSISSGTRASVPQNGKTGFAKSKVPLATAIASALALGSPLAWGSATSLTVNSGSTYTLESGTDNFFATVTNNGTIITTDSVRLVATQNINNYGNIYATYTGDMDFLTAGTNVINYGTINDPTVNSNASYVNKDIAASQDVINQGTMYGREITAAANMYNGADPDTHAATNTNAVLVSTRFLTAYNVYNYGYLEVNNDYESTVSSSGRLSANNGLYNYDTGTVVANWVSARTIENQGSITTTYTLSASDTLLNNDASASIEAGSIYAGTISTNTGKISADTVEVSGAISNSNSISATTELLAGSVTNASGATLSVDDGTLTVVGTLSNAGSVSSNVASIDEISNTGSITSYKSLSADAITNNTGTITAPTVSVTEDVVNGGTINASTSLRADSLSNSGSIQTSTLTLIGELDNTSSSANVSASTIVADSIGSNEGSIEATTISVVENVNNSNELTATRNLTVGSMTNSGTVTTAFMEATDDVENNGGKIDADVLYTMGTTTTSGEIDATNYYVVGDLEVQEGGSVTVSNELSLQADAINSGSLTATGATNIAGSLTNYGTLNLASVDLESGATLTSAGDDSAQAYISSLFAEEGSEINADGGTMDVAYLSADNVTYNQTGGTFKVESGWFSNSTLNIMGGVLDDSENSTQSLGVNTINISGDNPVSEEISDSSYLSNHTIVLAETVTSDTTINILSGGVLVADTLDLDGTTENSITVYEGGALQTTTNQIFDEAGTDVFYLDAEDHETGFGYLETEILGTTNVGAVKDSIQTGLDLQSGSNLVFSDEYYNSSLIVNATKQLAKAYSDSSDITVNFIGNFTGYFTVDTVLELAEAGIDVVENPGVILSGVTLTNSLEGDSTYKNLYVGYDQDDVLDGYAYDISMGFQDIANAENVYIANGKELALTGTELEDGDSYNSDVHKLLVDSDNGGTITVNDGTFTFGSHASLTPTAGWVDAMDVAEEGEVNAKNGEFGVNTATVAGTVNVAYNAALHIGTVNLSGEIVNEGTTYLDELALTDKGLITNNGVLNVTQSQTFDAGTIDNYGTANFNEITIQGGQLVNNEGSVATDTTMTVAMSDSSATGISGAGQLAVDTLEVQSGVVDGSYIGKDDKSTIVNVSESGTIQNATGSIDSISNEGYVQFNELTANNVINGVAIETEDEDDTTDSSFSVDKGSISASSNQNDRLASNDGTLADTSKYEQLDDSDVTKVEDASSDLTNRGNKPEVESSGETDGDTSVENGSDIDTQDQDENQDTDGANDPTGVSLIATVADEPESEEQDESSTDGDTGNGEGQSTEQTTPDESGDGSSTQDNGSTDPDNAGENGSTGEEGSDVTTPDDPEENDSTGDENNAGNSDDSNQDNGTTEDNGSSEENGSGEENGTDTEIGGDGENVGNASGDDSNNGDENSTDNNGSTTDSDSSGSQSATMVVENASYGAFTNYASAEFGTLSVDTLDNQGDITVNTLATINSDGSAVNTGTITGEGELLVDTGAILTNEGAITTATLTLADGSELVNNDGESEVGVLNANAGSTITMNDGTFIADSIVSDGEVTYNQYGGTFKVNEGFFTESTLNIYGGTLDASENSTNSLGDNVINISSYVGNTLGEINNEDLPEVKYEALEGLSTVITNTLTSETTVNIYEGGLLYAETLDFDGTEDTVNLEGGALMTETRQLFEYVQSEAIRLDATSTDDIVELDSEIVAETAVGDMKENVIAALNVAESSNLLLADEYFTSSLIVSVTNAVAEGLGDQASNLTINFLGDMTGRMTVDMVHALEDEGLTYVQSPGIVLNNETLWNETEETGTDNRGLIVGQAEAEDGYNAFETSMGFKNLENADEVRIVNGAEFALVGDASGAYSYDADESKLLTDSEDGGVINVENGTFTMGTYGAEASSVGWVNEVNLESSSSTLNTKNGEFGVWTIANEGLVDVGTNSTLHTNTITGGGNVTVDGSLYVESSDETDASFDILEGATVRIGEDGYMNVRDIDSLEVSGQIINEGEANYSDMSITSTGKDTNIGYERGEWLTVAGRHGNTGTSIWLHLNIEDGGVVDNGGDMTVGDGVEVEDGGELDNTGGLDIDNQFDIDEGGTINNDEDSLIDATDMDEANDDGTVNNDGTILWPDLNIGENGEDNNNGYEEGDHLHNHGHYNNHGEAHWKDGVTNEEDGNIDNTGDLDIDNELTNEGDITNEEDGTVDTTDVDEVDNSGNITNKGTWHYHDMHLHDGGTDNNYGEEDGNDLTVDEDSQWNNHGHADWKHITNNGGEINNDGDLDVEDYTQNDGDLNITGGDTDITGDIELNGGNIIIGNDLPTSEDNEVNVNLSEVTDSDVNIYVKNNGDLGIGDGALDWADSINAPNIPDTSSRLVITTPVTTNEGGIAVGPNVYTDSDNHVDLGNGDLYFADGSTTIIDASMLTDGTSAFTSNGTDTKVTVEEGATLILSGITKSGQYTITENYATSGNVDENGHWIGGWITEENLYAIDVSGIEWTLTLGHDDNSIWVDAMLGSVTTVYPDVAIPNISDEMMQECTSTGDSNFVCGILRDTTLTTDEKTRILNSVANIGFAGGAMSVAMGDLTTAIDSVHHHLTFDSDNFNAEGYLWAGQNLDAKVWLDVNGGWSQSRNLSATGIHGYKSRTQSYGFVLGVDKKIEMADVVVGGAFSFNGGQLKSKGGTIGTKNSFQSYGAHIYANWSPNPLFNLIGSLNYFRNNSDITQNINAAGYGKAKATVRTDMFALGVRAETNLRVNEYAQFVPHAEVRYIWSKTRDYDTHIDGSYLWSNHNKANNVVQFPIGVAYRGDIATESGWSIRPQVDVSVIPQAGNTKQKTTINYKGTSDDITGQFMGNFGYQFRIGAQAKYKNMTYGLRYGFTGGTKGRADHSAKIEARWTF